MLQRRPRRCGGALGLVLDDDLAEEESAGLAAGPDEDAQQEGHVLADAGEVDGEATQHRRVVPDVVEGEACELAAPAQRQRDAAERRQELVAAAE